MDVKTAFFNEVVSETVYMKQPKGVIGNNKLVCKLNKYLYGLKQSAKCWNDCFNHFIITLGFERSKADHCLYFKVSETLRIFILLYVDDMILTGNNGVVEIKTFKQI